LSGCETDAEDDPDPAPGIPPELVAKWYTSQAYADAENATYLALTINAEGTATLYTDSFDVSVSGGRISFSTSSIDAGSFAYEVAGTVLALSDGEGALAAYANSLNTLYKKAAPPDPGDLTAYVGTWDYGTYVANPNGGNAAFMRLVLNNGGSAQYQIWFATTGTNGLREAGQGWTVIGNTLSLNASPYGTIISGTIDSVNETTLTLSNIVVHTSIVSGGTRITSGSFTKQ
jgi:hypothetical protein